MNDGIKGAPTRKKSLGHPASSARSQSHTVKLEHLIHMKIMNNMINLAINKRQRNYKISGLFTAHTKEQDHAR